MENLQIRNLVEVEKTKFTDHVISFFKGKLEEGYWYLPPFLTISRYTSQAALNTIQDSSQEVILALHLKLHLSVLKFVTKDLHNFSKSVVDAGQVETYFNNLMKSLVSIHQLSHASEKSELLEVGMASSDEIIRVLYNSDMKHRGSLVDSVDFR